jgi:hypothetical protein
VVKTTGEEVGLLTTGYDWVRSVKRLETGSWLLLCGRGTPAESLVMLKAWSRLSQKGIETTGIVSGIHKIPTGLSLAFREYCPIIDAA